MHAWIYGRVYWVPVLRTTLITRLRRFAVGVLKSFQKPAQAIAQLMRKLSFRTRLVFDYLRMTANSLTGPRLP